MDPWFDPGAVYSLPYGGGPTGIAWRTDKIDSATIAGSWDDLWQTPDADGHKYVLDQIEEALGMSLQRLGYDVDTEDPAQLDEAAQALIELKPKLAGFSTDDINLLANAEAWVMQAWAGDVYWAAQSAGDPSLLAYKVPQEGGLIGWDMMSISVNAQHPGTALLFIDWMLEPEHAAQNVRWHGYQSGTKAGDAAWAEVMKDFPQLEIPADPWDGPSWKLSPTGERQRLMNAAWTRVKAG
jgi:spermidine/putrescine transport system substrate-binding protein